MHKISTDRLYINSIPKAGSHLLVRLMRLTGYFKMSPNILLNFIDDLKKNRSRKTQKEIEQTKKIRGIPLVDIGKYLDTCKPGEFLFAHLKFDNDLYKLFLEKKFKMIMIIRDPRDLTVSLANWALRYKEYRLYNFFTRVCDPDKILEYTISGVTSEDIEKVLQPRNLIEKIKIILKRSPNPREIPGLLSVKKRYEEFMGWTDKPEFLTVKFEDLIGEKGGGDEEKQIKTINKILNYLDIKLNKEQFEYIKKNIFYTKSKTFHKGKIGSYKERFNPAHKRLFNKVAGDLLERLGYPKE